MVSKLFLLGQTMLPSQNAAWLHSRFFEAPCAFALVRVLELITRLVVSWPKLVN